MSKKEVEEPSRRSVFGQVVSEEGEDGGKGEEWRYGCDTGGERWIGELEDREDEVEVLSGRGESGEEVVPDPQKSEIGQKRRGEGRVVTGYKEKDLSNVVVALKVVQAAVGAEYMLDELKEVQLFRA